MATILKVNEIGKRLQKALGLEGRRISRIEIVVARNELVHAVIVEEPDQSQIEGVMEIMEEIGPNVVIKKAGEK